MAEHSYQSHHDHVKSEKSDVEFKEHERIIMQKRIAEINHVITRRCHAIWNEFLASVPKPQPLEFNFVFAGLNMYLQKCDEYRADEHKDNKQKWWNNQKASEMSQEFLPLVLHSTDHMAKYLGEQIRGEFQIEFTNYVMFELLETAITAVFSTLRSGSNEVFLRTSFQYAKAGLRRKLMSYFGEIEIRQYDTKARRRKDLWQKLIKRKKERLLLFFQNKQNMFDARTSDIDTKFGVLAAADDEDKKVDPSTFATEDQSKNQYPFALPLPQLPFYSSDTSSNQFPILPSLWNNYNGVQQQQQQQQPQSQQQWMVDPMHLAMLSSPDDSHNYRNIIPSSSQDHAADTHIDCSNVSILRPSLSITFEGTTAAASASASAAQQSCIQAECMQCRSYRRQVCHLLEINQKLYAELNARKQQQQQREQQQQEQQQRHGTCDHGRELPAFSSRHTSKEETPIVRTQDSGEQPYEDNSTHASDEHAEQHVNMSLSSMRNVDDDVLLSPSDAESQQHTIPLDDSKTPKTMASYPFDNRTSITPFDDDAVVNARFAFPAHTTTTMATTAVTAPAVDNVCSKHSQTTDGSRSEMSSSVFSHPYSPHLVQLQRDERVQYAVPAEMLSSARSRTTGMNSNNNSRNVFVEYQPNAVAPHQPNPVNPSFSM